MVKKIKFPLKMGNGAEVRNMEELRENFSLSKVLEYIKNGKLVIWLRDRYCNAEADAIESLNIDDENAAEKICEIFKIPYDDSMVSDLKQAEERKKRIAILRQYTDDEKYILRMVSDLKQAEERKKRIAILRQYTDDEKYIDKIDSVAFEQNELCDLLDDNADKIYLCGDRFSIPLSKSGVTYIGINRPIVLIDSQVIVNWNEKQILLENVVFDEKYQAIIDSANAEKEKHIGDFDEKGYLNFMLSPTDISNAKKIYNTARVEIEKINYDIDYDISKKMETARKEIEKINYDIDFDILKKKESAHRNGIIGFADSFLNNL